MNQMYDDLMSVRAPVDVDASPDGRLLSVVVQRRRDLVAPRLERDGGKPPEIDFSGAVTLVEAATGEVLLTWGWPSRVWSSRWAPHGQTVLAVAEVDGTTGIWACSFDGTDRRCLLAPISRPAMPTILGWSASGAVVLVDVPATTPSEPDRTRDAAPTVDHLRNTPEAGLNAGDGMVMAPRDLVEIDLATGATRTIVPALPATGGVLSPDGYWIACLGVPTRTEMSSFSTSRALEIRSTKDGRVAASIDALRSSSYHIAAPVWDPASSMVVVVNDGALVMLGTDGERETIRGPVDFRGAPRGGLQPPADPVWSTDARLLVVRDTGDDLWAVDVASRRSTHLALPDRTADPYLVPGPDASLMGPDAGTCLAVVQSPRSLDRELWALSLTGAAPRRLDRPSPELPIPTETLGRTAVPSWRGGQAYSYYVTHSPARPPEIFVVDGAGDVHQLTHLNRSIAEKPKPSTQYLHYQVDGEDYPAFLQLPPGYTPGDGTIPVVVDGYPAGPLWGQGGERWEGYCTIPPQLLLAQGWAVLSAGATPARDASTRAELLAPILAGVDALVAMGIADDRVALIGQSAGGYLANCAVTVTSRFRAAVAFNGAANLSSHFGQLYISPDGPLMHGTANAEVIGGGPPWAVPERYVEKSPLFHLDDVETPLLLVHGTGDKAAMVQGADEMFVGLRRLGKHVEILRYHGEGHGPLYYTEPNRTHMCGRVIEFLAEHLEVSS